MPNFNGRRHVLAEPCRQSPKVVASFVFVDLLITTGRGGGLFTRARIEAQRTIKRFVAILKFEEDLVGLLLILEVGSVEWLQKVEIKVARRLRGGTLVRCAEEEVAAASGSPLSPLDLVFPDTITGHVWRRVRVLEYNPSQSVEVVAIKLGVAEGLSPLFD
jgi:hypothetical protein